MFDVNLISLVIPELSFLVPLWLNYDTFKIATKALSL